jgi:hypothetical protein
VVEAVVRDGDVELLGQRDAARAAELRLGRHGAHDAGRGKLDGAHVVAVVDAEQLHAVGVAVHDERVAVGVDGDARRAPADLGAVVLVDGVQVRAVAPAQHLHAQVAVFRHNKPLPVQGAADRKRRLELTGFSALRPDASHELTVCFKNLKAVVAAVAYDDLAGGVQGKPAGVRKLARALAKCTDRKHEAAGCVVDSLNAMIALVSDDDVVGTVHYHALWTVELAFILAGFAAAERAQMQAVPAPKYLHAVIIVIAHDDVTSIDGDSNWMVELPGGFTSGTNKGDLASLRPRSDCDDGRYG